MAPTDTALRWTHEKPTVPGFYWYAGEDGPEPVQVVKWSTDDLAVYQIGGEVIEMANEMPGRWYGPITPPADAE